MIYSFDTELATKFGVNESIMLNNFTFWIKKNKANNQNFFDGTYWTFNSARAFKELFPFWTERQIRTILKSLEDKGILISGNYNKVAYDRTKWYAISNDFFWLIDVTKMSNGADQNVTPIPDIKPNNKTHISSYDEYVALYNAFATECNKPKIIKLTDSRKAKLRKRDEDAKNFLKAFEIALVKARSSEFLLNGTFFSFDWLIENDTNIVKVLEDKYKNKESEWK